MYFIVIQLVFGSLLLSTLQVASQPDSSLKQLIRSEGYPVKSYEITTQDGYKLTLHRIPHGRNQTSNPTRRRTPILMLPSLLASSADWVVMGKERALGYLLAENGFDVWMLNTRGTTFSRKHQTLDPDNSKHAQAFWNFSFHEIGVYDAAASIDFILAKTRKNRLQLLGFSQGTTATMVLLSERPEYLNKVTLFSAIAPVAYTKDICSPTVFIIKSNWNKVQNVLEASGMYEFVPHVPLISYLGNKFCSTFSLFQSACAHTLYFVGGSQSKFLDKSKLPLISRYTPAGASVKQIGHFLQVANSDNFEQYDYGKEENIKKYGQEQPPKYNLTSISIPIAIYSGGIDCLATPSNTNRLKEELPNIIHHADIPDYAHIDFIYAKNVHEVLNRKLIETALKYM